MAFGGRLGGDERGRFFEPNARRVGVALHVHWRHQGRCRRIVECLGAGDLLPAQPGLLEELLGPAVLDLALAQAPEQLDVLRRGPRVGQGPPRVLIDVAFARRHRD